MIEPDQLIPEKSLSIKASVKTAYGNTVTSESLVIIVPKIASGKVYCGPCQLADRDTCANLDGVCWNSYKEPYANVSLSESECRFGLAEACYEVWKEDELSNRQCEDFVKIFDFSKMSIRPTVVNASYLADGSAILVNFSHPMRGADFSDCSEYFDDETLNYLPESYPGEWVAPNQLRVDYSPDAGIMTELVILADTLYYDYEYAQAGVEEGTIEVSRR